MLSQLSNITEIMTELQECVDTSTPIGSSRIREFIEPDNVIPSFTIPVTLPDNPDNSLVWVQTILFCLNEVLRIALDPDDDDEPPSVPPIKQIHSLLNILAYRILHSRFDFED